MRRNPKVKFRGRVQSINRGTPQGKVHSKRLRGGARDVELPFEPPEDWHEPTGSGKSFRIIVQDPGQGFKHILTPAEVRNRLAQLPPHFSRELEVVQFSRMTRKKQSFPCYGMQWGNSVYLYPMETNLTEYYGTPPSTSQRIEAQMYGGRWIQESPEVWKLVWTEAAIKDFYLNNILIHELGHLLDNRNSRHCDRERFAEWFALEHGYKPTRAAAGKPKKKIVHRHGR